MPRAEAGTIKHLSNKMKSKGLQRLRWYCQPCEKQCRDENGYKCHVMSESHMRRMALVTDDPRKHIKNYSNQFKRDFLQLLKTAHGEKAVHMNKFYQEYIRDKDHIHMNATQWPSLTEFAKYLAREGICRVTEEEKGIFIAWIDDSPEALRRREELRNLERVKANDDLMRDRLLKEQEKAARELLKERGEEEKVLDHTWERKEGETIKLNLGLKRASPKPANGTSSAPKLTTESPPADGADGAEPEVLDERGDPEPKKLPFKFSFGAAPGLKKTSIFAVEKKKKKNPLASSKSAREHEPKKLSNMERIMKEEMERKRRREESGEHDAKRRRF
jgi:DNA/RNA-binding protein KIN17